MSDQPWKAPGAGDTLSLPDGRIWEVTAVHARGKHQYPGQERVSYEYTDAAGSRRTAMPMLREFVARIGGQVRQGAVYRAAKSVVRVVVPVMAELPFDARLGDLVSHDGRLLAQDHDEWVPARAYVSGGVR